MCRSFKPQLIGEKNLYLNGSVYSKTNGFELSKDEFIYSKASHIPYKGPLIEVFFLIDCVNGCISSFYGYQPTIAWVSLFQMWHFY